MPTYLDPRPPRALPAARSPRRPGCVSTAAAAAVLLPASPPLLAAGGGATAESRGRARGAADEQPTGPGAHAPPPCAPDPRAPTPPVHPRPAPPVLPVPTPRQNTRPLRAPPPCAHAPPDPLPHAAHVGPRSATHVPCPAGPCASRAQPHRNPLCTPRTRPRLRPHAHLPSAAPHPSALTPRPRAPTPTPPSVLTLPARSSLTPYQTDAPRPDKALRAQVCPACRARGGGAGGPRAARSRRVASGAHSCPGSAGVKGRDGTQLCAGAAV